METKQTTTKLYRVWVAETVTTSKLFELTQEEHDEFVNEAPHKLFDHETIEPLKTKDMSEFHTWEDEDEAETETA